MATQRWTLLLAAGLCATAVPAGAATLDVYAGVIAGPGTRGCTQVPAPALAGFFTFSGFVTPDGPVAACGYTGSLDHASGIAAPLTLYNGLAPVAVGSVVNPGLFDGSAQAIANYGALGAAAHGHLVGQPVNGNDLFESVGAASFTDTLTASSPLVARLSAGFVSYRFHLDGRMATPGPQAPFSFAQTYTLLDVQHQGGPVFEIFNAHTDRNGPPTIRNRPPPAGWVASTGSLAGGSDFTLEDMPMVWGQPWDLKVGLLAWAFGTGDNQFQSTARLVGITLFDVRHEQVRAFDLAATSGTQYLAAVPEPTTAILLLAGLGVFAALRLRRTPEEPAA